MKEINLLKVKKHECIKNVYYPLGLNDEFIKKLKITKRDPYNNTYLSGWFHDDGFLVSDGKNLRNFLEKMNIPYKYWNNAALIIHSKYVKLQ